jgi:hypothetical protein
MAAGVCRRDESLLGCVLEDVTLAAVGLSFVWTLHVVFATTISSKRKRG